MTKKELMKDIGNNLKRELEKRDMSQNELARRTGLSKSIISYYVRGDRMMTLYNLFLICYTLGCEFRDIAQTFEYVKD